MKDFMYVDPNTGTNYGNHDTDFEMGMIGYGIAYTVRNDLDLIKGTGMQLTGMLMQRTSTIKATHALMGSEIATKDTTTNLVDVRAAKALWMGGWADADVKYDIVFIDAWHEHKQVI